VLVKGMMSNSVNFQYTVTKAMDATFKGSITTKTQDAFSEFWTPYVYGQVYVKDVTDKSTTEAKGKISASVGFGKAKTSTFPGSDPTQDTGWQWFDAVFDKQDSTTGYHIYKGRFKPPLDTTYAMAFRFSYDSQGFGQKGEWIYGDTDETTLAYEIAKEATVTATAAKIGYCQDNNDCVTKSMSAWTHTCLLSKTSWKLNKCVDCLADADCKRNSTALGPWCDTTKMYCVCKATTDCTNNPNGFLCQSSTRGKICSCKADKDCPKGRTCNKGLCQ
jgi:hypothetical protein